MENKISELENKTEFLENKIIQMENTLNTLLEERIQLLHEQLNLLRERQEQESILFYEHLQFMNYSQKIKNTQNEILQIKSDFNQFKREKYRGLSPLWR